MDTFYVSLLRYAGTSAEIVAMLPHCLIIYLTFYKTPQEFQNFSTLIFFYSLMQFLQSATTLATFHETVGSTPANDSLYVYYGLCEMGGPITCFILDMFTSPLVGYTTTFPAVCMAYRVWIFKKKNVSKAVLWFVCVLNGIPWIYTLTYRLQQYISADDYIVLYPVQSRNYTLHIMKKYQDWQYTFISYLSGQAVPIAGFVFTILMGQYLIYLINKFISQISSGGRGLHRDIAWMLTVQAVVPLITAIGGYLQTYSKQKTGSHPIYTLTGYLVLSLHPTLDGLATIFCLPHYRKTVRKMIFLEKRSSPSLTMHTVNSTGYC